MMLFAICLHSELFYSNPLCLSLPYVEKPFNSKVIKSFVPELRSRKCFLCFGIPTLSLNELRTFYVHFTQPYIWLCKKQNSKCRLCGDRDETINHIISECSKLAQREYKARHDWVGKMIHWEMCRKSKFDHTNKWYMHNPAHVLENDTHKLLWDFNIQTDHLIPARRPELIIINKNKENLQNCRLCCPGWPQSKTEIMWKEG